MTTRAFKFLKPVEPDILRQVIARQFGVREVEVCVYEDARDTDAPDGRLWQAFDVSKIRIFLAQFDPEAPATPGWFAIETASAKDNAFDDRPVARAAAAALGQRIIFRDPVPDPHDSPYVEAAQIGIDPSGQEEALWIVEYADDDGRDVTRILRRADL